MLNFYKLIEILVSLQALVITTMLPVYIPIQFIDKTSNGFEIPITWQVPTIILLTLIFHKKVIYRAFTIYIILGLFIFPIFHQGGSIGYLLTPNFGYLLGLYPLINIIDNLNTINKINVGNFLKVGFIAIGAMHLTGIFYNFIQIIFYSQFNLFLYNLGKYSLGKIGYHFLMLFPLLLLIKPIERLKRSK
ncbi:biotin biosynthesis protein BioY [Prochlorococcus marinus str. MU1404]|uniref:biotin transporter BioY n=1 Tax=Prochlorococcus marinus TaxID=1219 RepID=UPI001ADA2A2A|nr:biotin transporter BioY [Prochlorococcus marinus]MBO8230079.1 biotin transporter BioY [Prochlorococcus marinus XMU1404]MBW3073147.1 biotin biosynthesis protein BioY [Prochlorococcus marinus str. MU1404]MCR8545584.1 biotin transporter BioY [Prochlorococcus marinus CUG1432]